MNTKGKTNFDELFNEKDKNFINIFMFLKKLHRNKIYEF